MSTIEFIFDFGSPNAYFTNAVLPGIAAKHGAKVDIKPILLGGLFKITNNKAPWAAYQGVKAFAKMTLHGAIVWYQKAPMESGKYAEGEDISTKANWSRKGFLPTNFAFLDDGGFLLEKAR